MSLVQVFEPVKRGLEVLSRLVTWIGAILLATGFVSKFFEWGKSGPFRIFKDNIQLIWLITLSAAAITLGVWISRLHKRFISGFADKFDGDLRANWDFVGPWRIAEKKTLLITGSDAGGITKVGAQWENYTLAFKARIIKDCLGVIVRAHDLNNYYMFQIRSDSIVPHRRAAVPIIDTSPPSLSEAIQKGLTMNPIKFEFGWEKYDPLTPLQRPLVGWFNGKVIVRGESVAIYIDSELVFQKDSFLKISTGKVGFRNSGEEAALIRNVKVILHP